MKKIIAFLMLVICSLGVLMSQTNSDTLSDYYDYRNENYDPCDGCYPTYDYLHDYTANKIDTLPSFIEEMFSEVVNFQYWEPGMFEIGLNMVENKFDTFDVSMLITDTLEWSPKYKVYSGETTLDYNYGTSEFEMTTTDGRYTKRVTFNQEVRYLFGKIKIVKIELFSNITQEERLYYYGGVGDVLMEYID